MKCWICGDEANSGEHILKASDLSSIFGTVTTRAPLYKHTVKRKNQLIQGIKSDQLKFKARLCARCNNERTQPHDKAWEHLSAYLRGLPQPIPSGATFSVSKVFPGTEAQSMLNVHLYFAKLFGSLIAEHNLPIPIDEFAHAILNGVPHSKLWLAHWTGLQSQPELAGGTDLNVATTLAGVAFATWFYIAGPAAVNVMYAKPGECRDGLIGAWHPSKFCEELTIRQLTG